MRRCRTGAVALGLASLLLCTGCLAHQVKRDGDELRQAVLHLYADQAMDNLISAYENRPFVQVDYSKISVFDIDTAKTSGGVEQTVDQTHPQAVTAFAKFTRSLKNVWNIGEDASRVRRMSFYANPVTNADDVYDAYLRFANDPELFRATPERPTFDVHIIRKRHSCYYWVPVEAAAAYQDLFLHTAFMRGEDKIVGYRERMCVGLRFIAALKPGGQYEGDRYWVDFDAPVPNGSSTLMVVLTDGRKYKLKAMKDDAQPEGSSVYSLRIDLEPGSALRNQLSGNIVRVYSDLYPPELSESRPHGMGASSGIIERSIERLRQTRQ